MHVLLATSLSLALSAAVFLTHYLFSASFSLSITHARLFFYVFYYSVHVCETNFISQIIQQHTYDALQHLQQI